MNSDGSINDFLMQLFNLQSDVNLFWAVMKILFLVAFFLYVLFSIVVVRQVFMMTQTFKTRAEGGLKIFAIVHLIFAVGVFMAAFLIL